MKDPIDERSQELIESDVTGAELQDRLRSLDAERVEAATPIYPETTEIPPAEARDLAQRFRTLRDEHRGEIVAPISLLPGDPGRVSAALYAEGISRMEGVTGGKLRALQRDLAEVMVDLQSFRPDDQAALILSDPTTPAGAQALAWLMTARAATIASIRDDPGVLGALNAIGKLDIRIGDGRKALDAVNRYREKQAFGFLAMFGLGAIVVVAVVVFILIRILT